MKRTAGFIWAILLLCLIMTGCAGEPASSMTDDEAARKARITGQTSEEPPQSSEEILIISDESFASEIEYISFHPDSYVGRAIKFSGLYSVRENEFGDPMSMVYRKGHGHSHGDAVREDELGFEILYDGISPEENDRVEVTGVLEYSIHGGMKYLAVRVNELTIIES